MENIFSPLNIFTEIIFLFPQATCNQHPNLPEPAADVVPHGPRAATLLPYGHQLPAVAQQRVRGVHRQQLHLHQPGPQPRLHRDQAAGRVQRHHCQPADVRALRRVRAALHLPLHLPHL